MSKRWSDALYHDEVSDDETTQVRLEVRAFAEQHVAPRAAQISTAAETPEAFPREIFGEMAAAGLFGIPFAAEVGGRGLRFPASATCAAVEELAYFSNSVAAIYDVHCILAGHSLAAANEHLQDEFLRPLIRGDIIASFATSEPDTSSDISPSALGTRLEEHDGTLRLTGHKRWITNAPVADAVIVLAADADGTTAVVLDTKQQGLSVGRPDRKMGNRAQLTADIVLDAVEVPAYRIVGVRGGGLKIALRSLTYGRIGIGAAGVGMAQRAFDEAAQRMTERSVFGKPLATMQHWQFRLADRAIEIESARSLFIKAARRLDQGIQFPEPEAAMAKIAGTALAVDMARDAVQVFGGYGFAHEVAGESKTYPLEAIYRDAKIGEIYEGANELQRWVIARAIFGREFTG